ncbi:MAG: sugar-binding domain-containing protein, partial [Candidatus Sumerlaeota bacterium]
MQTKDKDQDFRADWLFKKEDIEEGWAPDCDDAQWQSVTIPHCWNIEDMSPGQPRQEAYVGPAWYRKHFALSKDTNRRYLLLFEAVANFSEVWVDGCFVGGYDGGFLDFRLDITDALSDAEQHVVAVRADNSFRVGKMPPELLDWERYGGIYRPVWLIERSRAYIDHQSIRIET